MMDSKKCTKCFKVKTVDKFHFDNTRQNYKAACKDCTNAYRRRKGLTKEQRKRSIQRSREFYKNNKESVLEQQKEYSKRNKGKVNRNKKKYYKENSEKIRNYRKLYYLENKEAELSRNKKYSKANKGRCNSIKRKYDISKQKATPKWAELDKIRIVYEKALWLENLTGLKYHVDHIIPLQGENVCGLHVWANLQILEASLNCSKRNSYYE